MRSLRTAILVPAVASVVVSGCAGRSESAAAPLVTAATRSSNVDPSKAAAQSSDRARLSAETEDPQTIIEEDKAQKLQEYKNGGAWVKKFGTRIADLSQAIHQLPITNNTGDPVGGYSPSVKAAVSQAAQIVRAKSVNLIASTENGKVALVVDIEEGLKGEIPKGPFVVSLRAIVSVLRNSPVSLQTTVGTDVSADNTEVFLFLDKVADEYVTQSGSGLYEVGPQGIIAQGSNPFKEQVDGLLPDDFEQVVRQSS